MLTSHTVKGLAKMAHEEELAVGARLSFGETRPEAVR